MNKKQLAIELSKLECFEEVKANYEQYSTDSETAAYILWDAFLQGNIENKIIADLGCGNGIFGIGALMLNARLVYFVDIDKRAINIAIKNCKFENAIFKNIDISKFNKKVDTVIMNPPFGVQEKHADKLFLEKAMEIADNIYSIHKIESKNFIEELSKDNNFEVIKVENKKLILRKTMRFHKTEKYPVDIGIWTLKRRIL